MEKIRLASADEIDKLQLGADITPQTTVVAFDNQTTGTPDFAVLRNEFHIEPMLYGPETTARRKLTFIWAIEGALRLQGTVGAYYFNLGAGKDAKEWRDTITNFGAEQISTEPEFRFKRLL